MSRRTLKGGSISYVQTSDFSGTELASDASDSLNLRSRRIILKPMDALSDTSDAEEVAENYQTRSRRSTRSRSNDMPRTNGSLTRTINTVSTAFTTTTTLHRGLDTESDGEDGPGHQSAIPLRPTPLSRKSGTPLGRAMTPLSKFNSVSRRSSTLDAGKGYKLGEGTIAEDLEEEDERLGSTVMVWSRKTWQQITRITTIITASITMMAASALTPTSKEDMDIDEKKSSSHSFTSTVRETRTRIVTTVSEKYNAACERLRKNPILIWIPLLLILLLLAFLAYWWLLQSRGKTAGATDPTENDGPSFFFIFFKLVSDLVFWVYSGISSTLAAVWVTTTGTCTWLATACKGVLVFAWLSIVNMFTWLGSLAVSFAASLLQLLYLSLEYLQYCALGVTSFFTSSASFLYGLLPFATSNDTVIHDSSIAANLQDNTWSFTAWVSNVSPKERLSEMYVGVSERVQSLGTKLWDIWLWQVLCIGEMLSAIATNTMWLLSSICSAFVYLLTGLWTLLTSFILAVISAPTVITSSAIVSGIKSNVMNIFQSREELVNKPSVISTPSAKIETIENIVQQSINIKEGSVEEIVRQVLDSEELKRLIAAAVAENSKGQLTVDAVSGIAKSVVEREFGVLKEETSALKTEIQTNAAANAEHQNKILQLQEEKAHLINELAKLGQRLYNVEGKIDIADQKSIDDRQENEEQIEQLIQQINKLEVDHTNLAADVKSCCDDKKVPAILGEIFGLTANGTTDEETAEGQASLSAGDIGVWLRSYFVAKTELESRLNSLMATMQVKTEVDEGERNSATIALTQAAVDQTTQIVMDAVLEKLRGEMNKQHHQLSEETQQQVKAAAGILGQQVLEQVQLQVQNQKQQLSETLKVNVDSAVQDAVSSALPGAVDSAVETAVEKAVSSSVDVAVMNAVNTAVPTAVNEAVPQAVEKAVPEAVAELLPNAVSEQVATAVPEVVASVLPAAVSTAVNETVTSVVSEAMVHVSLNKAGDQTIEINQKVVKNEIVGVVGSTSAAGNHSHEAGDGGIFVPGMHMAVGLNESAVIQIVQDALKKYDADKTGMVDHALESAGGNIISTRCTESYQVHQAEVRVLGFPVYRYSTNNPRTVIQPDTMPGQCWAFKGSQGYIVIQLAGPVQPTGFTLEHISKSLSPNGAIDSAPREFEVWGLSTESDEGVFLGIYEYREDGDPLQYFPVREENTAHFPLIELKINSNHGNLQYTCLYRFRVHGFRLL